MIQLMRRNLGQMNSAARPRQPAYGKSFACRCSAFTLTEICIVVTLLGLLAAVAVPHFARARVSCQQTTCINNLRQIDNAVQTWALEARRSPQSPVKFKDIAPFLTRQVVCPAGGRSFEESYVLSTVAEPPECRRRELGHILPAPSPSRGWRADPRGRLLPGTPL